jgi:hypothetical protein
MITAPEKLFDDSRISFEVHKFSVSNIIQHFSFFLHIEIPDGAPYYISRMSPLLTFKK